MSKPEISPTPVNNTEKVEQAIDVLYEDNHLLVVNKRPGDLVQGDQTGDQPLLEKAKAYIKIKFQKPGKVFLGVVHRLDRPTSGVVVFARTSKALTRLNAQFKSRTTQKNYWAIVEGYPNEKQRFLEHWLVRNTNKNKSFAYPKEVPQSKQAQLDYQTHVPLKKYTCLNINLHTGRHHQIRAQLSAIGMPIKGDLKYGAKRSNPNGSIHLHARTLTIDHPTTKERLTFTANPPKDALWQACLDAC